MIPSRTRLPARRASLTEGLEVDGCHVLATVGFDTVGQPKEIFLVAGKAGSMLNALLADAAVAVSVALQCGISAGSMAKSIGRVPDGLEQPTPASPPASPLGAALDLLARIETGTSPTAK